MHAGTYLRLWKLVIIIFPIVFLSLYLYNDYRSYNNKDILDTLLEEDVYVLPQHKVNHLDAVDDEDFDFLITNPEKYITKTDKKVKSPKLKGRFLHITDPHPDPYYIEGGLIQYACHRDFDADVTSDLPKGSKFGDPMMGCDSPMDLVVETFNYISRNFPSSEIDFIVWTGDNSRHDNDRKIPRTSFEIMGNNMDFATRLLDLYPDTPIIPTIGNNDIYPHNLMDIGPSMITRQLGTIYQGMIPEEQRRLYERFGSFFKEVVPGKLVILSLNSMLFFKKNPLVDSCMSPTDSGYQHLLWLGSVLNQFRTLGIKCWIISHVPLIQKNLEESCYLKINLWIHEYRDVIIGNLMGHMNLDYFNVIKGDGLRQRLKETYFMNSLQIEDTAEKLIYKDGLNDDEPSFSVMGAAPVNKEKHMAKVRKEYKQLNMGIDYDDLEREQDAYHIINVAGSIIPTFNPAFRLWEYNTTDTSPFNSEEITTDEMDWCLFFEDLEKEIDSIVTIGIQRKRGKKNPKMNKDKSIPKPKPKSIPNGPAFENQFGTPLSFTQYFLKLNKLNKKYYKLKDTKKYRDNVEQLIEDIFAYEVEYTSTDLLKLSGVIPDKIYYLGNEEVPDLTVKTYLEIMKGLVSRKKIWKKFLKWVYVSSGYEAKNS
ncbi:related to Endopolyphosphatase [Hanseniaspora guilliermondii]|uniref:Endopolyphosphatase n=1 Tax=Hanseniaspora guilliermondii TaxID=56406 RepID=A0A1L0FL70_9ASCO|nr:related to Endopolyphosphatase [Hanseniaspora guilliermondii]